VQEEDPRGTKKEENEEVRGQRDTKISLFLSWRQHSSAATSTSGDKPAYKTEEVLFEGRV
jgi:hypothetical protein